MRFPALLSSFAVAAVLGGCGVVPHGTTRSNVDPLSFAQTSDAGLIADQAVALNLMADQLVRRSTVRGAVTGAVVSCGLAAVSVGSVQSCVVGAAAGGAAGAAIGQAAGQRDVEQRVELVSANALVRSIRGMNGQMSALQSGLPELLAEQDAELVDLKTRRSVGAISRKQYEQGVANIRDSRAMIAEALSLTITKTELASANMAGLATQGQSGLDWHLSATNELAREAHSARARITPLTVVSASQTFDQGPLSAPPRSGELR